MSVDYIRVWTHKAGTAKIISERESKNKTQNFNIYPNPAKDFVAIDLASFEGETKITLENSTGQVLHSKTTTTTENTIPTNALPSGIYFIKINNSNGLLSKKLIIK